jgi:hypothetical protein
MINDVAKLFIVAIVAMAVLYIFNNNSLSGQIGGQNGEAAVASISGAQAAQLKDHQMQNAQAVENKLTQHPQVDDEIQRTNPNVLPHPQMSNNFAPQGNFSPTAEYNMAGLDCFPKDQLVASDLLPREGGFSESNPVPQGQLANRNFFESGYHAGVNTQGGSLRNANLQIRPDPPITRVNVGPWHISTIEQDTNRNPKALL